jgi:hypothetical protein
MRCHICDRVLEEPRFNMDHNDYEPCETCLAVINDTLDGYKDNAIQEEELEFEGDIWSYDLPLEEKLDG